MILILHGDLDPGTVSHSSQWSVHTQERDGCNGCQNAFDGELDSDYADSTGSHSAFGDCPQQKCSNLYPIGRWRLFLSCCRVLSQEMYPSDERNSFVYLGTGRKRFFIVVLPETDKTVLKLDRRNRLESTQWGAVSTLSNR